MATKSTIKNMRYSNMILQISVGLSPNYSTVTFKTITPGIPIVGMPLDTNISLSNRDGSLKKFRSSKSLYAFLSEVYSWPVHPDLLPKDLLLSTSQLHVL